MKKLMMSVMGLMLVCAVACIAQNKDQKNDDQRPNPMAKMIEELGLTDEQVSQFEAVMKEMHPQCGERGEGRPCPPPMKVHNPECKCDCPCCQEMRQRPEAKDSAKCERPTPEMMEQKKAEMEAKRAEIEAKIKEILTPEQFEKFQKIMQERREHGPGEGDPRHGEGPHHGDPKPLNEGK